VTRRVSFTQADVSRAIRAARKEGVTKIEVRPDGRILLDLSPRNHEVAEIGLAPAPAQPSKWEDVEA
jgi:hypothetical protein